METRRFFIPCLLMFLCILLGAFGAHGLKPLVSSEKLASYETAVRYHFYGTTGIFILLFIEQFSSVSLLLSRRLMLIGTCLFAGSVYLLVLVPAAGIDSGSVRWLGPVTPMGGSLLMLAWLSAGIRMWKKNQ
jgi:uncharacterized membrane protein YgdD (TMEM256/DUF423 family)